MVLAGVRDTNVKNGKIYDEHCPKCNEKKALHFSIYRRYTHLTLIPLFPVGKLVYIHCENCETSLEYEDLTENAQTKLRNEKLNPTPWVFIGSVILGIFTVYAIYNYLNAKDETAALIKKPTKGDIYDLKFPNGYYSNMRIDKITIDSIYTTHNDFNAYLPYETDELDKAENYSDQQVGYTKKEILELYQKGEIIKISRKNTDPKTQ